MAPPAQISRREARRAAVFMLFQWDLTGQPLGSLYEGDVDEYAQRARRGGRGRAAELDARITAAPTSWTADRLGVVERNVLRVALEELDAATCRARCDPRRGGRRSRSGTRPTTRASW